MKNILLVCLVTVAGAALAVAQSQTSYHPAVPAGSTTNYAPYGGYSSPGTVAGSQLQGMASAISAAGDYNLSTSAAMVNLTQAQKNEIENRKQWTDTYFDMRATNRAATAAERGPPPTMEQVARMAQWGVPKALGPGKVDPVTGALKWPTVLKDDMFAPQRTELEQIFAKQSSQGAVGLSDQMKAGEAIDGMYGTLKQYIRQLPTSEYLASRDFLQSLKYTACKTYLD